MGPFSVTQPNPTHQLTDPTQPDPRQVEKSRPNPTHLNPTLPNLNLYPVIEVCKMLNCLRQQAAKLEMSDLIMQSSTIIKNIRLRRNATQPNPTHRKLKNLDPTRPNPTQPMDWPNPWTTLSE